MPDVGLPGGTNGQAVAAAACGRGLPVVFVTGYAATPLPQDSAVIGKSFDLNALAMRVEAMLRVDGQTGDARPNA